MTAAPDVTTIGVLAHEEAIARELILDQFKEMTGKRELPRPCGYFLALRVFVRPEKIRQIYLADVTRAEDKYQSVSALVCDRGPDSYRDPAKFPYGPWCRVGDWVLVPRYEGFFFHFNGVAMLMLPDDRVLSVVADPMSVSLNASDKIVEFASSPIAPSSPLKTA